VAAPIFATNDATLMIDPPIFKPRAGSALFCNHRQDHPPELQPRDGSVQGSGMTDLAHGDDGVLASEPDAFNVYSLGEIPDLLLGVDRVIVPAIGELPDNLLRAA